MGSLVVYLKKERRRLFLPKTSTIGGSSSSGSSRHKQSMALSLSSSIPGEFPVITHISRSNSRSLPADSSLPIASAHSSSQGSANATVPKATTPGVGINVDPSMLVRRNSSVDSNDTSNTATTTAQATTPSKDKNEVTTSSSSPPTTSAATTDGKTMPLDAAASSSSQQPQPHPGPHQTQVNIFNPKEARQSTLDYRAALWAIGHIGSTELGMATILEKGKYVDWLFVHPMYVYVNFSTSHYIYVCIYACPWYVQIPILSCGVSIKLCSHPSSRYVGHVSWFLAS